MAKFDMRKRAEWQQRLKRFAASGLTLAQFCRNEDISPNTFYYWAKRLGRASRVSSREETDKPCGEIDRDQGRRSVEGDRPIPLVHFHWGAELQISVPADCVEAIRCVLEYTGQQKDEPRDPGNAFQEVILAE